MIRLAVRVLAILVCIPLLVTEHPRARALAGDTLPTSLSNAEFWSLSEQLSEPESSFRASWTLGENVISNEKTVSSAAAQLAGRVKPGGVYLGVGPEQNFTYIAATRPRIAFITDIRRRNLQLHLLYKAVFEASRDRTEFVGRLFGRKPPSGLTRDATARELMNAYLAADTVSQSEFQSNLKTFQNYLTGKRDLPLTPQDLEGMASVYRAFHRFGPAINYLSVLSGQTGNRNDLLSYAALASLADTVSGAEFGYLSTDERFSYVKGLQRRNLIIPVVGDFAGQKALRAIGEFVRRRGAVVGVFYLSNVVGYLPTDGTRQAFCANVASMPMDNSSLFVFGYKDNWLSPMAAGAASCFSQADRSGV